MDEPKQPSDRRADEDERRRTNLIMFVVAIGVVVAGVWLVNKMVDMRKMQECAESGRHNCAPIDVPDRRTW
jgi:hypothetical protein